MSELLAAAACTPARLSDLGTLLQVLGQFLSLSLFSLGVVATIGLVEVVDIEANGLLCFYIAIDANVCGFPFFGPSGCAHLQVGFKTGGAHFV